MALSPDLILFAIQTMIKLSSQIKKACVDVMKRKALTLPLPEFPSSIDEVSALNYFEGDGEHYIERSRKVVELQQKEQDGSLTGPENTEFTLLKKELPFYYELPKIDALTRKAQEQSWEEDDEKDEYARLYRIFAGIDLAESGKWGEHGIDGKAMVAVFAIAQWSEGTDPNPTALKRIAGTLIEIAVDYYAHVPGALNDNSAHARALRGFFKAIDDENFVDTPIESLAESLFVATVETLSANPDLVSGDEKGQLLIEAVTRGIAEDAKDLIQAQSDDLAAQEKIQQWGQLVFRSVLANAGQTVLANPDKYLSVQPGGQSAMVSAVGMAVLDTLISTKGIDIEAVFSREALDRVVKAALKILSAHPELIEGDNEGVKTIISQVAKELSETSGLLAPEILPELIRLILEKTALNLNMVWPGDKNDAKQHLLILATREVMAVIATKPLNEETWRPCFTMEQVLDILELVLDEVVQNPDWMLVALGEDSSVLHSALNGALNAFKKIPKGQRLSLETAQSVIKSSLRAVALRMEFVEKIPTADDTQARFLVTLALESVFDVIFDETKPKARWVLSRGTVIEIVVDSFLHKLALEGASEQKIAVLKQVLIDAADELSNGKPFSLENLEAKIAQVEI